MTDRATELGLVDYDLTAAQSVACARRELNAELAVRAYNAGRGVALHRPVDIYLQVASACNLDCYMCSEHNRPEQWRGGRGLKSLPPELFEKIEREVFPYAKRLTIGVGGEPMISRHFQDYLERAHAAGLDVHVMTNGTQIYNDARAEALARCTVSIEVSVDAATPETYERIRRGSRWATLVRNLQRLNRFRDQSPEGERSHLTLCFVLMKSNVHEFPLFVDLGKALGADRVSGWHVIPMTPEGHGETLQDDRARSNAYCEAARRRGEELGIEVDVPEPFALAEGESEPELDLPELPRGVPFHVAASLIPPTVEGDPTKAPEDGEAFAFAAEEEDAAPPAALDLPPEAAPPLPPPSAEEERKLKAPTKGGIVREAARHRSALGRIHCASPSTGVFVFYDGRVLPCCHPHAHNSLPMGNLHEDSFGAIWNNHLYRNLREGLHSGDAPPLCQSCSIVHSPPPKVERFEDLVGPGKDLASFFAGRVPAGDLDAEKAFVVEALSEPWHKLYGAVESLAADRKDLREGYRILQEELADYRQHTKNLEEALRRSLCKRISARLRSIQQLFQRS